MITNFFKGVFVLMFFGGLVLWVTAASLYAIRSLAGEDGMPYVGGTCWVLLVLWASAGLIARYRRRTD